MGRESGEQGGRDALARALRRVLKPLVHLMVARQIPYPIAAELLKSLYVDVAERDFPLSGKRQTDSRISLLTGVHRKDVKRLRGQLREGGATPSVVSLGAQLVGRWQGDDDFVDAAGRPLPLPPQAADDSPSFERLVASVSTDIRARSVLDEWLRLGVVRFDELGRVVLDTGAFTPQKGSEEKLHYFSRNLHDHAAAAAHNMLDRQPPFMERSVHYGDLTAEEVEGLKEIAEREGMEALRSVNRAALAHKQTHARGPNADRRLHFGVYLYESETEDGNEDGEDA